MDVDDRSKVGVGFPRPSTAVKPQVQIEPASVTPRVAFVSGPIDLNRQARAPSAGEQESAKMAIDADAQAPTQRRPSRGVGTIAL